VIPQLVVRAVLSVLISLLVGVLLLDAGFRLLYVLVIAAIIGILIGLS
jgi:hypothetical protein